MKKRVIALVTCCTILVLAACGNTANNSNNNTPREPVGELSSDPALAEAGLTDDLKFVDARTISVGLWNRVEDVEAGDTIWAKRIAEQLLEKHNIIVKWEPVPRWDETEFQSTLLSAQSAPDVGYSFNAGMITTMAQMGAVYNLYPFLQQYEDLLPNLYAQVTEDNIFWNFDTAKEEMFNIAGRRATEGIQNTTTFIREDWLDALGLPVPTSTAEFEATLLAFRDRASELPGVAEGVLSESDIIPYIITEDAAWDARGLMDSFISNDVTEREWFVYGFDDRRFMFKDAMKDGLRVLNHWYNEGLLWNDFALSNVNDGQDLIRLGAVGALHANWDLPFRSGDGWTRTMRENINENANYIAINPFENDKGVQRVFAAGPVDRFVFFPTTNNEVLASLLYLDFMSTPEILNFLQFGIEGTHHEVNADGILQMLPSENWPLDEQMSGSRNFDITLLVNGVWYDLVDRDRAVETASLGYPGIESEAVLEVFNLALENTQVFRNALTRIRTSEEGKSIPLIDQRNQIIHRLIAGTNPANFDAEFEREYAIYMELGGTAIIEEREQAWIETFGDVDSMPEVGE
jgi:hypothetical protein